MPVRPATFKDLPTITSICTAAFYEEELNAMLFPHRKQYPEDYVRAWRHTLLEDWWNYRKIYLVSYEVEKGKEVLTGMVEWTRYDKDWSRQYGIMGWWDPRLLVSPLLRAYHTIYRLIFHNRASVQPTPNLPNPYTYWTWRPAVVPFVSHYLIPPTGIRTNTNQTPSTTLTLTPNTPLLQTPCPQPQTESDTNNGHIELSLLAVHPSAQKRGHGRLLSGWGLDLARQENVPAVVVAADFKEPFYRRCGFTELVGYATDGEGNPLRLMGVGGGAVLWTEWPWKKRKEEGESDDGE